MRIQATCTLLAALLLAGCGSIDLPRGTRVYAGTPVTEENGNPIALGGGGDFMAAAAASTPDTGLKLNPGDVLYVRRWSAGNLTGNLESPSHFIDRIPLRRVYDGERLTDAEEAFLLNLLVTNRQNNVTRFPDIVNAIRQHEGKLWTAVVDSLRLKRVRTDTEPFRLVATVNLPMVLGNVVPQADADAYFSQQGDVGIDGIDVPLSSAPNALMDVQGNGKNEKYYRTKPENAESRLFSFVSAELGGVDIRNLGSEESQWTLRELQASGVCRVNAYGHADQDPQIVAIRIPGSYKRFWFDQASPTHEVVRVLTQNRRSRRLVPLGRYTWFSTYILPVKALDQLTVSDVSEILWRTKDGFIDGPAHCQPRGGRR
jgi:hypothetical protein